MRVVSVSLFVLVLFGVRAVASTESPEQRVPAGLEIIQAVNERDDGVRVSQRLSMTLTDARGRQEQRVVEALRLDRPGERRTLVVFRDPPRYRGTAFLTWDYSAANREDDLWLYLPAMRKERRVSAADRGSSFLGTDFSYEEIKNATKWVAEDYDWKTPIRVDEGECVCWKVEGIVRTQELVRALGHARVLLWVDPVTWFAVRSEYFDRQGELQRTVLVSGIEPVQGILTAHRYEARDHKSGHSTTILVEAVDYESEVSVEDLSQVALRREM